MSCVYAVCIDEMSEELYREIYQRMPEDRQNRTSRYKHHTDQMRSVAAYYALERALICYSPAAQDVETTAAPDAEQLCRAARKEKPV